MPFDLPFGDPGERKHTVARRRLFHDPAGVRIDKPGDGAKQGVVREVPELSQRCRTADMQLQLAIGRCSYSLGKCSQPAWRSASMNSAYPAQKHRRMLLMAPLLMMRRPGCAVVA
jgi:hypothetical protein